MTTQVKIEITHEHNPVMVSVFPTNGEGEISLVSLHKKGDSALFYVHSGQYLKVRELTPETTHDGS